MRLNNQRVLCLLLTIWNIFSYFEVISCTFKQYKTVKTLSYEQRYYGYEL